MYVNAGFDIWTLSIYEKWENNHRIEPVCHTATTLISGALFCMCARNRRILAKRRLCGWHCTYIAMDVHSSRGDREIFHRSGNALRMQLVSGINCVDWGCNKSATTKIGCDGQIGIS